jgi:hypothetical protein
LGSIDKIFGFDFPFGGNANDGTSNHITGLSAKNEISKPRISVLNSSRLNNFLAQVPTLVQVFLSETQAGNG